MECPRCPKEQLVKEVYEGVEIERCQKCQGAWLDSGEIVHIIKERQEIFHKDFVEDTVQDSFMGVPNKELETHLACPKCVTKMMKTFNYGADSGVLLDKCPACNGIWFDKDELEKVQAFREHWEKEAETKGAEWGQLVQRVESDKKEDASWSPFKLLVNLFYN